MNVLAFRRHPDPHSWQTSEVQELTGACTALIAGGQASGWDMGRTEAGDPQLYVLGPQPDQECVLSVSRLGRLYVVEDGEGHVLFEGDNMMRVAQQMRTALRRRRGAFVARIVVGWYAAREAFEEKLEPLLAEPVELLTHIAPQLAAFA